MKYKAFLLLLPLAIGIPTAAHLTLSSPIIETYAGESGYAKAKLPTEIDLNPVSEADVRSYYSALDGKNLQGDELLKALKPILKNGQEYHSYDVSSGIDIWKAYEITDRDWTLSPASEISNGTYNASTNKISGYKYGENSNKLDNPYLHVLYRNPGVEKGRLRAWDHHGDNNGFDREHIWAKSRGFGKNGSTEMKLTGARGDLHHLLPGDSYVNSSSHSNNYYGFVDPTKIDDNAGEAYKIDGTVVVANNYRGTSATFGSGTVFEPQDCDKGDIARACFYMVARYNNLAGNDDTIDAGNPNLFLNDVISNETIYSTPTKAVSYGLLSDLLVWHKLDPVDEYEIHRNDIVYRNFEKNRNPFIDFPEWVDAIWGTAEYDEANHKSMNRAADPKGVANPSSDPINTYEVEPESPLASIAPVSPKTTYTVGDAFVAPKVTGTLQNGKTKDVSASSTFSGYDLSKEGKQTVTITCGEIKATYEITVEAKKTIPIWIIAIGIGVAVLIIIVIAVWASKSKSRQKTVKKAVKKAIGGSSSSKKKSSSKSSSKKKR